MRSIDWPEAVPNDWEYEVVEPDNTSFELGCNVRAADGSPIAHHIDESLAKLLVETEQALNGGGLTDELLSRWTDVEGGWTVEEGEDGCDVKYDRDWISVEKKMTVVVAQNVSDDVARFLCRLQSSLS